MSLRGALRAVFAATVATCLVAAPSAIGAVGQPLRLGPGEYPNVTLEADGTADIAWVGAGTQDNELNFCRLPRGAAQCSVRTNVVEPGESLEIPIAFGSGNNINLISYRFGLSNPFSQVVLYTSGDGGASFGPGVQIGTIPIYNWAFGPGGLISGVTNAVTGELDFQAWSLTGNTANKAILDGDPYEYVGSVAMLDANTPIVVYASRSGAGRFRRYGGVGDVNDQASWTPAAELGQLDYPHVVSGPSGVYLIAQDDLSGSNTQARRYDGNTFGPRVTITNLARAQHAVEDGSGRLHWVGTTYTPEFVYATSDDGSHWDVEHVKYVAPAQDMRIAVAPDHYGVAVGNLADDNQVFAANIGPSAAEPTTAKFVGVTVVKAPVLVKPPGAKSYTTLQKGDVIRVGSLVDATKGRVRVTIALPNGQLQSSDFYSGIFQVTQAKNGLATMVLAGGNFRACGKSGRAAVAAKAKVVRQLWGSGKGKFRTKGRFAAATVRGTTWDTVDRCDGTLIKVTSGKVAATNLRTKKSQVVKAGRSFFARG